MKVEKVLLLAVFVSLLLAVGVIVSCGSSGGGGSDDDSGSGDDDNGAGDDDTGGTGVGAAYDKCLSFYENCAQLNASDAATACSYINSLSGYWNDCIEAAFSKFFDCLNGICDNYNEAAAQACATTFSNDVIACVSK